MQFSGNYFHVSIYDIRLVVLSRPLISHETLDKTRPVSGPQFIHL